MTEPRQVQQALQAHGYIIHQKGEQPAWVREKSTQVRFALSDLRPNNQDLHEQLQQAIQRTQREQERREALAQEKGAKHATITLGSSEQAGRIQTALEQAGANVWKVQPLEAGRVGIQVSYLFDWQTIEGISRVLDQVQGVTGVTLEEEYANRSTRTTAGHTAEREREHQQSSRDQGLSM